MHADQRGAPPLDVLAELGQLIGADVSSYTAWSTGPRGWSPACGAHRAEPERIARLHAVFHQHPGWPRTGRRVQLAGRSRCPTWPNRSRCAGCRCTSTTTCLGHQDQLLCVCSLDRRYGNTLAFNRARRGFTARDREVAELVTPHWAQAMDRRARLASLTSATRRLASTPTSWTTRWPGCRP